MLDNNKILARKLERTGGFVLRYGLVLVIFWFGYLKFLAYEAKGIQPIVSNSPLLSWAYQFLDMRSFSMVLGTVEIALSLSITMRPLSPRISAIGSLGAIVMFLTTLSFLITTPGIWEPGYGFPALSTSSGEFLLKDILLLGAAIWTGGEALAAASIQSRVAAETTSRARTAGAA